MDLSRRHFDATPLTAEPALEPEWLDRPGLALDERRRALADLRRVNGALFGHRSMVATVLDELRRAAAGPQLLLDVAAGSGDVGAAVARAARSRGRPTTVVSLDRELSHLVFGRQWGDVRSCVVARAEALPFRERAFDLAISSLFFHHLDRAGKASVAVEMVRVSRRGALIVDLVRSGWAGAALRLLFPLLGIGRIASADGLLSIERAWTVDRWRAFLTFEACQDLPAGVEIEVRSRFPARVSIAIRRRS